MNDELDCWTESIWWIYHLIYLPYQIDVHITYLKEG